MKCSYHDCPYGLEAYGLNGGPCLNCIDDERRDLEMMYDCADDPGYLIEDSANGFQAIPLRPLRYKLGDGYAGTMKVDGDERLFDYALFGATDDDLCSGCFDPECDFDCDGEYDNGNIFVHENVMSWDEVSRTSWRSDKPKHPILAQAAEHGLDSLIGTAWTGSILERTIVDLQPAPTERVSLWRALRMILKGKK
jgi:hypothetical protein